MSAWHENDEFWETVAPVLFTGERIEAARKQVDQLIAILGVSPPARILDMCCGVGRHSIELARRGFTVTGVDRTRAYLKRARAQAQTEGLKIDFLESDARTFVRDQTFDGAINMFTSFGYFEDAAEDAKVAENLRASLKPGGRLVVDILGKEILARGFNERTWSQTREGALLLEEHKLSRGWNWIENRWILIDGSNRKEFVLAHRLYSGFELEAVLKRAGFVSVTLYGNLGGAPYDHRAERLIAVAQK